MTASVLGNGDVPDNYALYDDGIFEEEGGTLSPANGKQQYTAFCAGCHGAKGQGNGPALTKSVSGAPAAFPAGMAPGYIYWRIAAGVPESMMPAYRAARVPVAGHDHRRLRRLPVADRDRSAGYHHLRGRARAAAAGTGLAERLTTGEAERQWP